MDTVLAIYHLVPAPVWAFIFGAPFIVALINVLKKLFGVNSTLVIHIMTVTTSFLVTAIPEYVLNNPKPFSFLGAYTTAFFTAANILYAVSKKLAPFWADVAAYSARKEAAKLQPSAPVAVTPSALNSEHPVTIAAADTPTPPPVAPPLPTADPTVFEG